MSASSAGIIAVEKMNRLAIGGTTRTQDVLQMAPNAAWFRAKQGDPEAQYVLAQCYLHGIQQEQSPKQALVFFGKAASRGHVEAQFHYGLQFLNGVGMPKKEPGQAVFWFTKAAQAGHAEAMYTLGMMSLQGIGMIESEQIALDWFVKASRLGFKEAQYRYATYLERGEYINLDLQKALLFYLKAAQQEHPEAQHRAAILYSQGVNLKSIIDPDKKAWHTFPSVITWAKSTVHALRLNEAKRWNGLPSVVSWQVSVQTSKPQIDWACAAYWHTRAAKLDFTPSKYALAVQLQDGLGLKIDQMQAYRLFREAALGHSSHDVGAMDEVQYICPHCGQWNRNEPSKEKLKGDIRCSKCREDRVFPRSLRPKQIPAAVRASTPEGNNSKHPLPHKAEHENKRHRESHSHSEDFPEIVRITLDASELKQVIRIKELKYNAEPPTMHTLAQVGQYISANVVNEGNRDSGPFYIEFYVCGLEDNVEETGAVLYGGRMLIQNVPARSNRGIILPHGVRCPLDAKSGDGRLWAGIKPISSNDLTDIPVLNWYRRAVAGDYHAILHVADVNWHGNGLNVDTREAIRWYRKCMGSGSGERGLICPQSTDIVIMHSGPIPIDLCPMTLSKGYKPAWLAFALCLDQHKIPQKEPWTKWHREILSDLETLMPEDGVPASWMYLAAEYGGIAQAQLNLAVWYVKGHHVPKSLPQAWFWFQKAADQGLADAQYNLALLYQGGEAVEADEVRAAELLTKAVDQGHIPAHLSLGVCYLEGKGVPADLDKAIYLLSVPAQKGWDIAQFNLGCLYARGWGLPRDYVKSAEWHYKAAQQGHREAQVCFAMAVYRGQGVPRDLNQAAFLFRKSAEQGHPLAQFNLGVMYARGEGVVQDVHTAAIWWEQAARQGHALAQFELGEYHLAESYAAEQELKSQHSNRLHALYSDRRIFERYSLIGRFETGRRAAMSHEAMVSALKSMDRKQYLRLLEDFQIVPEHLSREEAFDLLKQAPGGENPKSVDFSKFSYCILAIARKLKLRSPSSLPSLVRDGSSLIAGFFTNTKAEQDFKHTDYFEVNSMLQVMRKLPPPSMPSFQKTKENLRSMSEKVDYLKTKVNKERASFKFQIWRAKDASARYSVLRAETDALLVGGQSEELQKKRVLAERVRMAEVNAKNEAKTKEGKLTKIEDDLKKLLHMQRLAEEKAVCNSSTDQHRQDIWFADLENSSQKARDDMLRQDQLLKGQKAFHFHRAANLFLDASKQNNSRAQHNLGHVFLCDEPLPIEWLPESEEDLQDTNRLGLKRYRKDLETLRLLQEEQRNSVFKCFSFQSHGGHKSGSEMSMQSGRRKSVEQDASTRKQSICSKASVFPEKDQAKKEFEQWLTERFRKEQAAHWFMESAKNNHQGSQYQVGVMHLYGYDVEQLKEQRPYVPFPKDLVKAAKWLLRAAVGGYAQAQYQYALCLLQGLFEPQNENRDMQCTPLEWLQKSAEQEFPEALLYLAKCYERGEHVEQDPTHSRALLRKAAMLGSMEAKLAWANACLADAQPGAGAAASEAVSWLEEAAIELPEAKVQLARCLQEGVGMGKDEARALQLLVEAAEQGHAAASLHLGLCHEYGIGVARGPEKAVAWFVRAAERGDAEAMLRLYTCYLHGVGAAEDPDKARWWLKKAAALGHDKAVAVYEMHQQLR